MKGHTRKVLLVFVTAGSMKEARKIGEMLIERKLAACATVLPTVRSIYRWKGKIVKSRESVLMIKTTASNYRGLEQAICTAHSYETPEIIAVPVAQGLNQYLGWVASETAH